MFYAYDVTIPASTTEANPHRETLKVSRGILHNINLVFPRGCMAMVSLELHYHEHQIYPYNLDHSEAAEGEVINLREHQPLDTPPYEITVYGWSPSTTYDHTITVRLGILPESILLPLRGLGGMLAKFFKILGV